MRIEVINEHTKAFVFDELNGFDTAVFLINKPNRNYLIDTFCGADAMRSILSHIEQQEARKRLVVINTHHHYDHIWGNCLFEDRTIIAHKFCRRMIMDTWETQSKKHKKYIMGDNEMVLPNMTFRNILEFEDDGIEIFYSPGHTKDSISIFDKEQETLIVGDNLEKPLIYLEDHDLHRYLTTLEKYLDYQPRKITSSHSIELSLEDLEASIQYLKNLIEGKEIVFGDEMQMEVHKQNLKYLRS